VYGGTLLVRDFETEHGYDELYVNDRAYSGEFGGDWEEDLAQLQGLVPTTRILWSADEKYQRTGWRVCREEAASVEWIDWTCTLSGDPCTSFTSHYPTDGCTTMYSDEFDEDGDGDVHDGHPYCLAEGPEGNLVKTICGPCSCEAGWEQSTGQRALAAGWSENAYIECRACHSGEYKSEVGAGLCSPCEKGSYVNSTGATACTECGAGHYSGLESALSCTECGIGNFSDVSGMTACRKCYDVRN